MNQLIQEHLFAIIIFLLVIILILIGILVFIIFKLLGDKSNTSTNLEVLNPKVETTTITELNKLEAIKNKKLSEAVSEKYYCTNHKDQNSIGGCLICEDVFCEACLVEHEGMYFCRDHFKIFANNKWKQITDQITTPETPEDGLYIWDFKRYLWKEKSIPSFVLTHYKINVDNDFIESYVQLNVEENRSEELYIELKNYKAKH